MGAHLIEVLEGHEGAARIAQPVRELGAREHDVGSPAYAAVGDAVADIGDGTIPAYRRQVEPLARTVAQRTSLTAPGPDEAGASRRERRVMRIERQVLKPEARQRIGDHHAKAIREHPNVVPDIPCPGDEVDESVADARAGAHQVQNLIRCGTNGCELRLHGLLNAHPARDDVGG